MHILLWLLYTLYPVGLGLPDEPLFFCGDGSSGGRTLQRMHLTLSLTSFSLFHSVSRCAILNA